ncbi:MAG: hypothetical protein KJZ93_05210 [Caldilineaceae bacterium]|nr:hypothetical protein [Caldilineaceae bacterium]
MIALALLGALMVAGCARTAPPAQRSLPPAPSPVSVPPAAEEAIPFLIAAERAAARDGDRATLAQLWAEDAQIIDGRGTAHPNDDYVWPGRAAILDRYALAVFPSPPPALEGLGGLTITVEGDEARATHGGDHWRFVYREGRWWISELVYSQP